MNKYILILILLFALKLNAQQVWTYDSCINYALEHNLQLQQLMYNKQISNINNRQAYFNFLPTAETYGIHYLNTGRSINKVDNAYVNQTYQGGNVGLSASVNLFNGFQDLLYIVKSRNLKLSVANSVEISKLELRTNVLSAYLKLQYQFEVVKTKIEQDKVSANQLLRAQTMYTIGKQVYKDLLDAQSVAAANAQELVAATNNLTMNRLNLAQLMNLENSELFTIDSVASFEPDTAILLYSVATLFDMALNNSPYIGEAKYNFKASENELAIAKCSLLPTINAGVAYNSAYSSIARNPRIGVNNYSNNMQLSDNFNSQVFVSINVPLFERFSRVTTISKANVNKYVAANKLNQAQQFYYKEIQRLHTAAINAQQRYQSKITATNAAKELYDYNTERYNANMLSSLDFRISQSNYYSSLTDLLLVRYDYIEKSQMLRILVNI